MNLLLLLLFLLLTLSTSNAQIVAKQCVCNPHRSVQLKRTGQDVIISVGDRGDSFEKAKGLCSNICVNESRCNGFTVMFGYNDDISNSLFGCILYNTCVLSYVHNDDNGNNRFFIKNKLYIFSESSKCII